MAYHHPADPTPEPLPAAPEGVFAAGREGLEHQALLRVAAAAAGASHVEDVLELAAEEALVAVGAASLSVSRYERKRREISTLINVGDLGPGEVRYPASETYSADAYSEVGQLLDHHRPYFNDINDPNCDPGAARLLRDIGKSSDIGVPVIVEDAVWGEIWATRRQGEPPFDSADAAFLARIAGQFAVAIARAELFSQVSRLAYEDVLTGLPNRRAFEERLDRALEHSAQAGTTVLVMVCDLDGLKAINDGQGHEAGDQALRNVSGSLVRCASELPGSFVARLAGDEFCVLMEERHLDEALELGRSVLTDLAEGTGESLSCGTACSKGGTQDAAQLLGDADAALYVAKRRGGARVVSASESWSPARVPAAVPDGSRPVAVEAMDGICAELDGRLAGASTLDRLEAVAGAIAEAGNFAYWAISSARARRDSLRDLAVGDNRDRRHRGIRLEAGALEYQLADYPVTQRIVEAGSGGFVASAADPATDPAEMSVLTEMGFETVIGAVAASGLETFLVEIYGDERSLPASDFASVLRLAVRAAMPPRSGAAGLSVTGSPAA